MPKRPLSQRSSVKNTILNWVNLRRFMQILALILFTAGFIGLARGSQASQTGKILIQLSPLTMLANGLSSKEFLSFTLLGLILILAAVITGRAWCGWLCPMGTILDLFGFLHPKQKKQSQPAEQLRQIKYGILVIILIAAIFGNLTLLAIDPLTLFFRSTASVIWPALDRIISAVERVLYPVPLFSDAVLWLDDLLRPVVLPVEPFFYRSTVIVFLLFASVIGLNTVAVRFWCRYLCPFGGLLGIFSKLALFRREVSSDCSSCGLCEKSCPTGTIDPNRGYASDPSECTLCLNCLQKCPRSTIQWQVKITPPLWMPYDPNRRIVLAGFAIAAIGTAVLNSEASSRRPSPTLLRPPGTIENDFLSTCIRCGACIRACPTNALQPAALEAGVSGLYTPILIPRQGYCDYSCNACGEICPVQAIPPLALEEKRTQVIGKAYIDQNICIAWADHRDCIVCEEMCPLAEKAITLEENTVNVENQPITVRLPKVDREKCIGCGICEYKCPLPSEAAIRVQNSSPMV